jgi:hypothetical protein
MSVPGERARPVRPRALLLGAAAGFLACCAAGRLAGRHDLFGDAARVRPRNLPSTLFYPTAGELLALGEARTDPGRVAVVVGGNSVLYGVGQTADQLWTRRLQEELGDRYRVLNFAAPASFAFEFGGVGAEMLAVRGRRVVFVSTTGPVDLGGPPDGKVYRHLFWDAYARGLLSPDAARRAAAAREEAGPDLPELRLRMGLDRWCRAADLWNAVGQRAVNTAWSAAAADGWYRARGRYPDAEPPAPPPGERYRPEVVAHSLAVTRSWFSHGVCARDAEGRWVPNPGAELYRDFAAKWRRVTPEPLRGRTLLLLTRESPFYLRLLTADEREHYEALCRLTAGKLRGCGFRCRQIGEGFLDEDYADRCHLTGSGGRKLAGQVAAEIRELARELGYVVE